MLTDKFWSYVYNTENETFTSGWIFDETTSGLIDSSRASRESVENPRAPASSPEPSYLDKFIVHGSHYVSALNEMFGGHQAYWTKQSHLSTA